MSVFAAIQSAVVKSLEDLYQVKISSSDFQINQTKPEFEGDYTVVLFSLLKALRKSPDALGKELGDHLIKSHSTLFSSYNVIKGFLNLSISDQYWSGILNANYKNEDYGKIAGGKGCIMVEYSSPNTNKPLHLGHLRNNFLGWSIAEILKANGYEIVKTCIVNDRGVHICKSMLAWQKFGNGSTPESTGIKGDHLVGDFYVMFETELRKQAEPLYQKLLKGDISEISGDDKVKSTLLVSKLNSGELNSEKKAELESEIREIARYHTPIMQEVREMLLKWEQHDPATIELWKKMNGWVYEGFDATYKRIGVEFDKTYYESNTYLLGKKYVEEGLGKGIFFKKSDGSVWIDLTADGLDEKLLLRKDGTSVYITQDLGLAKLKYDDYHPEQSIYVIGDEQNYHMRVLKLIAEKLGLPHADGIYHLSYGMVELPSGKMKSREGTSVDADDLVEEMILEAKNKTAEQGKIEGFTKDELQNLYDVIGLGGLKFFLLKVDPRKKMVFNPAESIDLHGFTATFIQYAYARIKSILRKETPSNDFKLDAEETLLPLEKELIILLEQYGSIIEQAGKDHDPSVIANYVFHLAQTFNSFYSKHSVSQAETHHKKELRLMICQLTSSVIKSSMALLGIKVPDRM
ncbi:MAG: arginine--tRNA ligase [Bacteroidetes bacterium]|nr:MAG: arginine--tRNA ligase [Bacteroidota bacterium]